MKILLLIGCVLFQVLGVSGENPEMPAGNGNKGVQAEQWNVTNYPAAFMFCVNQNLKLIRFRNDGVLYHSISHMEPRCSTLDQINASAERDCAAGVINKESLRIIGIICGQLNASEI